MGDRARQVGDGQRVDPDLFQISSVKRGILAAAGSQSVVSHRARPARTGRGRSKLECAQSLVQHCCCTPPLRGEEKEGRRGREVPAEGEVEEERQGAHARHPCARGVYILGTWRIFTDGGYRETITRCIPGTPYPASIANALALPTSRLLTQQARFQPS